MENAFNSKSMALGYGALKALRLMQGQLKQNFRPSLLFLAVQSLDYLRRGPVGDAIMAACPGAADTIQNVHIHIRVGGRNVDDLSAEEVTKKLEQTITALKEIACFCETQTGKDFKSARELSDAAYQYVDMATHISDNEQDGNVINICVIDPAITAKFLAAYMIPLSIKLTNQSFTKDLRDQRNRIANVIRNCEIQGDLQGGAQQRRIMNALDKLSDVFLEIGTEKMSPHLVSDIMEAEMGYLSDHTAHYSWQQYQIANNDPAELSSVSKPAPKL